MTIPIIKAIAALIATATLGTGATGTATAAGLTDTRTDAAATTVTTTADTSGLPDHLVNGDFEYPSMKSLQHYFTGIDRNRSQWISNGQGGDLAKWSDIPGGLDTTRFGWSSTQTQGTMSEQRANAVELQKATGETTQMGELCASQKDTAIYQDIATMPGTLYRIELDHTSRYRIHLDQMQVMVGAPGHEQPVEMTRTSSNKYGDKIGEKSTTIATHSTNPFGNQSSKDDFSHYVGYYTIPAGQSVTRFTFRQVSGVNTTSGNLLDNIVFTKAYKLSYDRNSDEATGQTPNDTATVKPAKTSATGGVKNVADTNASLPDHLVNGDFEYLPDGGWKTVDAPSYMTNAYTSVDPNNGQYMRNAKHSDADLASWVDWPGFDQSKFAWKTDQKGGHDQGGLKDRAEAVELQQDSADGNTYAEMVASETGRTIYQNLATIPGTLYKIRLKHASLCKDNVDQMQVVINGTPIEMTRVAANGKAGDKVGEKSKTIGTRVTNGNRWHHYDQWETYEGYYVIPDGQTTTRFGFKAVNYLDPTKGNLLDDVTFARAYKLSYDRNASDATGKVPSDETAGTVRQTKARTTGIVRLASDDKNGLPDHLVNGTFDYRGNEIINENQRVYGRHDTTYLAMISAKTGVIGNPLHSKLDNWDPGQFGWSSNDDTYGAATVEVQRRNHTPYPTNAGNVWGEISAAKQGRYIYQDIATTPGVMYKWSLKHASRNAGQDDSMQVKIGEPGKTVAQQATRTTSNGSDKTGSVGTTITTHGTAQDGKWETYTGTYIATSTVTRFTFKSVRDSNGQGLDFTAEGNCVDDLSFDKAYRLSYDKNATDANGSVPSDETAGTVKQAKAGTTGALRLASDDVAAYAASNLPKQLVNSDFDHDWRNIVSQSRMTGKYNFANVDPAHGDVEISGALNGKGEASKQWVHLNGFDANKFGWKSNQTDTRVDGRGGIVEIQRSKANDNMYAEITASQANTYLFQDIDTAHSVPTVYTVKLRYAHRNGTINSNEKIQILVGTPGHEQPVTMTRIASRNNNRIGEKSTTVNAPNSDGWLGRWDKFQGSVTIPAGQDVTRFTFKALGSIDGVSGNLIDDVHFQLAYPLTYDKNAGDATGSVPSNQRGKENTVQPAEARGTGTVKTVADGDSSKSLTVNPGFDVPDYSKLNDGGLHWMYVSPAEGKAWSYYDYINPAQPKHQVAGLSQATFGWQELTGGDYKTTSFELHREKDGNVCADVHGSRTIGQTIDTQAGVAYTVSIRHSGRSKGNAGSVQVLVGPDKDHLRPLEMSRMNVSRTGAKYGDRIGKVGTVVTTHSDSVDSTEGDHPAWDHSDDWETYSGTYVATGGKTVFAYRGVDKNGNAASGTDSAADSVIDDLSFKLAYPLVYDKNADDATGSVPSSQYGKENTVQPAKAKTTGTVRTVTDKTTSGLTVHDLKNGEIAPVQYGDFKFSTTDGFTADQITDVNGFTVKTNWDATEENQAYAGKILSTMYQPNRNGASLVLHHVGQWRDSSGTQRWLNARITVNGQNLGSLVYLESKHEFRASYGKWDLHPSSRPYMDVTVDFLLDDGSTPQGLRGATGFTDIDGGTSGYNEGVELVSGFDGAYVRSDAHLARFGTNGWAGITDENKNNADAHGMKHYVGATFTGSSFRVRWSVASGQARQSGFQPVDSTIAYRLTYDKNAQDATGSIPSDTAADTTRPAKSETDGKVSDLVQRTTTHEDGSVTVKTIDTSTDVVSGCQVYYPAGQRITLATMAKDDDCWDSSMLTRPGHTQLGWNQDRNATAAQPEVTMVEGGMTVYAVWVGNPVLTYDTNKPNTWTGQMPSTPASVSVPYNTAAADGSGWQSGDTSKIRGYRFLGWYTAPQDNAGLYDWNTPLTGSVTVYAHWERLKANVIYNRNAKDAKGSHANTTGWQYSDVTIPSDTSKSFTRAGYRFMGWNTRADGKGTNYADGAQIPLQNKDITLYAQWKPLTMVMAETGGRALPILLAAGTGLLIAGIGVSSMLARRRNRMQA